MNYLDALGELAGTIKAAAAKVNCYFWQLSGDAPNSLCKFLCMGEEELKVVLRLCKIYIGEKDNFSKNNFPPMMTLCGCDSTTFKLNGKLERFIKIGEEGESILPKDMFDAGGSLSVYPIEGEHVRRLRTKSQKGPQQKLVDAGIKEESKPMDVAPKQDHCKSKQMISPKSLLISYVQELVTGAVKTGEDRISLRSARNFHRLLLSCVDVAAKELLHASLEKYANQKDSIVEGKEMLSAEKLSSSSTARVVSPPDETRPAAAVFANVDEDDETVFDIDDDEESIATTTKTDDYLSELKEEVLLQSLLHKRIHDKKERVFNLVHRNGRRLLVVLPPDSQSITTFEEEANSYRLCWRWL
jgi:hypothetical protein